MTAENTPACHYVRGYKYSGMIYQNGDSAKLGDDFLNHVVEVLGFCYVSFQRESFSLPYLVSLFRYAFGLINIQVGYNYVGPLLV